MVYDDSGGGGGFVRILETRNQLCSMKHTLPRSANLAHLFFFLIKFFIEKYSDANVGHQLQFSTWYVSQHYFVDIHPPLAKLIHAFVLWIVGFKGIYFFWISFSLKILNFLRRST
jgi:dolichyl-phosphate-mannose--protein O-mannosyl transferase